MKNTTCGCASYIVFVVYLREVGARLIRLEIKTCLVLKLSGEN